MTEFEKCAREYCDARVEYVDLKRLIRLFPCPGGFEMVDENGYDHQSPCWFAWEEGEINEDEMCEACQTTRPMVYRRRELGKRLPNLAKAMYREFRREAERYDVLKR